MTPAIATLLLWMIVPLVMTIHFSVIRFSLMQPDQSGFIGLENFEFFVTDPGFWPAVLNTDAAAGQRDGDHGRARHRDRAADR